MSLRRTASFTTMAAVIGALVFVGPVTAANALGEPDGLYSVDGDEGSGQFVQLDKTDATPTLLGSVTDAYRFTSVEVVDGLGYAIGVILGPDEETDEDDVFAVFTWNITTGAVLTAVPVTHSAVIVTLFALDTRMDGLLISYVAEQGQDTLWIASIDPVTGAVDLLVDLSLADEDLIFEGLATNPVDGITYALADFDDDVPAMSPVDFDTGTLGDSIFFEEVAASLGGGWFSEGDFDEFGVLWFTYSGDPGGVGRTNAPTDVGVDADLLGDPDVADSAITVGSTTPVEPAPEPELAPELAATGSTAAALPAFGVAAVLLGLGAALMIARRNRRA